MGRFSNSALVVLFSLAFLAFFLMLSGLFTANKIDGLGFVYLIIVGGGSAFIPLFLFQIALDFIVRKVFKIKEFTFIKCLFAALTFSLILFTPYVIYEIVENPILMDEKGISYFYDLAPFLVYLPVAAFAMNFLDSRTKRDTDPKANL